ncbi:MAG: hypothetical protein K2X47_19475 [Bdellovibrionales bacterium]|nr:hypothetical protein [Bdellovibrionales bacterium]
MKAIDVNYLKSGLLGVIALALCGSSYGAPVEETNYDVLYCKDGGDLLGDYPDLGLSIKTSPEFVGSYAVVESRMKRRLLFSLPQQSPDDSSSEQERNHRVLSVVRTILGRIEKFDPPRAELYSAWAQEFFQVASIANISGVHASSQDVPGGCGGRSMIFQREPKFKEDYRYYVAKQLWKLMDINHQAAAILQAFVARELSELKRPESAGARYFTAKLLSTEFQNITLKQYLEMLKHSGLYGGSRGKVWADGELYYAQEFSVSDKGVITAGKPVKDKIFKFGDQVFVHAAGYRFFYTKSGAVRICLRQTVGETASVNLNGRVYQVPAFYSQTEPAADFNFDCSGGRDGIWIFPNGKIRGLSLALETEIPTSYGKMRFRTVFFDSNGQLSGGDLAWKGGKIKVSSGRTIHFRKGVHYVEFTPEGLVVDKYGNKDEVWGGNL